MKTSNCSKNYVNCRKHPARTSSTEARVREDHRVALQAATAEYKEAKKKVDDLPETASKYLKDKTKRAMKIAEYNQLSAQSDQNITRMKTSARWSDGSKMSTQEYNRVAQMHQKLKADIRLAVEREDYYAKERTMNPFQQAVTSVLIEEGDFYQPTYPDEERSWGDTRGSGDYYAKEHFQECGVKGVNSYTEDASWSTYDSINSESQVGVKAELSCNCGEKYKSRVYLNALDPGTLISKIMNQV